MYEISFNEIKRVRVYNTYRWIRKNECQIKNHGKGKESQ